MEATDIPTQILSIVPESLQHINAVVTSLDLTILVLAAFGAVFVTPPIDPISGLHRHKSMNKVTEESSKCSWFWRMPRSAIIFSWFLFTNICLALSMIFYFYHSRNPTGKSNSDWYISIESLFFFLCILKYLWMGIVWNMHHYAIPMIMAIIKAIIMPIVTVILIILLGVRHSWAAMALMIPVFLFYIALPLWSILIFTRYRKSKAPSTITQQQNYFNRNDDNIDIIVHSERRY